MKKMLAIISSVFILGAASQSFAADTTPAAAAQHPAIAVVNVQQMFQQSPKIADLNKQLQSKFKARQDKLVSMQKTLEAAKEKYRKESPTMAEKDKTALQKKITDDQAALAKEAVAFQKDLNTEQSKVMKTVLAQLNEVISGIAKKNNYSVVLDSQAVIYAGDNADITKQVSKEFDNK